MLKRWLAMAGPVLACGLGCGGSDGTSGTSLRDLQHPSLHVVPLIVFDPMDDEPMGLVISADGCVAPPPGLAATVNGEAMVMIYVGGQAGQAADGGCTQTTFRTPSYLGHPDGNVVFSVTDGMTTWGMTVPNLYATRMVSVQSPPGNAGMQGQLIVLQWSPTTDTFDPSLDLGYDLQFDAENSAGPTWDITSPSAVTVTGSMLQWTIPPPVADAIRGAEGGALHFSGSAHAAITNCTGVPTCTAEVQIRNPQQLPFEVIVP